MRTVALFLVLLVGGQFAFGQVQYHEHERTDEVLIEYRWQKERFFARNPHALLNMRITNLSDEHMIVRFNVGFYRDLQLFFESEEFEVCLEPGESIRGRRGDLRFRAEDIRMDTVEEEWFSWDLLHLETLVTESCE